MMVERQMVERLVARDWLPRGSITKRSARCRCESSSRMATIWYRCCKHLGRPYRSNRWRSAQCPATRCSLAHLRPTSSFAERRGWELCKRPKRPARCPVPSSIHRLSDKTHCWRLSKATVCVGVVNFTPYQWAPYSRSSGATPISRWKHLPLGKHTGPLWQLYRRAKLPSH